MPVSCRENTFTEFVDHRVVDRRVVPWVDRASFRQMTYRQADKAVWDQLSARGRDYLRLRAEMLATISGPGESEAPA